MQGDARRLIVAMQAARPPFVVHGLSVFPYLANLFSLSLVGVLFRGRLFFVAFYVAACYRRTACRQLAALASRFARRRAACGNAIEE